MTSKLLIFFLIFTLIHIYIYINKILNEFFYFLDSHRINENQRWFVSPMICNRRSITTIITKKNRIEKFLK